MVNRSGHPMLYTLTSELIWPEAIDRARSHPHEVNWQDDNGGTALHRSCRFQFTIDVIREMLKSGQSAACIQDKRGYTPLHVACWSGASDDIIELLLNAHRDAASLPDMHGRTPLHLACSSVTLTSAGSMDLLIQAGRDVSMSTDNTGKTPLSCLCERNEAKLKYAMQSIENGNDSVAVYRDILRPFWAQLRLLLNANAHDRFVEGDWRLVHALTTIPDCPQILFELALKLHPEQVKEKVCGSLPLHLAAECPTSRVNELYKDGYYVCSLVSLFPKACEIRDSVGRLPFHIAIQSKKSWRFVLRKLFEEFPQAIILPDGKHFLLPFMLGALESDDVRARYVSSPEPDQILTSMVELLRLNPAAVKPAQ